MIEIPIWLFGLILSTVLLVPLFILGFFWRRNPNRLKQIKKLRNPSHGEEDFDKEGPPASVQTLSLLQATLDSTADGILVVDRKGKMVSFNRKFSEMWRIPQSVLESRDDEAALSYVLNQVKDPQGFLRRVKELYDQEEEESYDVLEFQDGRFFERFSIPQKINKKTVGRVWSFRDITDRKKTEESLQESNERIRVCMDHSLDAIIVMSSEGEIISWNPQAEKIFGWSRQEALGLSMTETIIPERYRRAHKEGLKRFLSTGEGRLINKRVDFPALHKDGHEIPIELAVSPARIGQSYIFSAFLRDISEQKKAEEDIKKFTEELQRSNKELERFAYVASHDLQEPLQKITLFGDRLKSEMANGIGEQGQDYLDRMQKAALNMKELIKDLLEFARVTTRPNPFEIFGLEKLVQGVLGDLEVPLSQSEAKLSMEGLPKIEGDSKQIRQVFFNLISNAIKFRKKNEPLIIGIHGEIQEQWVHVKVEDNGIGFEMEYSSKIFESFQRLHGRSEYEGSGIGLAICQRIVERHGGRIYAKSQLGQGAQFIMKLPLHQPKR